MFRGKPSSLPSFTCLVCAKRRSGELNPTLPSPRTADESASRFASKRSGDGEAEDLEFVQARLASMSRG